MNKVANDEVMGVTVTFIQAVRGLTPPDPVMAQNGRELVLVEVTLDATKGKYYSSFDAGEFEWKTDTSIGNNATSDKVKALLQSTGRTPFPTIKRGGSGTGWIAGYLPKGNNAQVGYYQLAFGDNSGNAYPRKDFWFPLS